MSQRIAYYSESSDEMRGHTIWKTPDGKLVKATEVCKKDAVPSHLLRGDNVFVGAVTEFVSMSIPERNNGDSTFTLGGLIYHVAK